MAAPADTHGRPATIALQPTPRKSIPVRLKIAGATVTAVARFWRPDDMARCRLCAVCSGDAEDGFCLVLLRGDVPDVSCPLLSTLGMRKQPAPLGAPGAGELGLGRVGL